MSKESALALTAEPTPVETPTPEAPKALDSEKFAAFAKKEADYVKRQEQLKREREEVAAEREKLRPLHEQYQKYQEMKVKDPIEAMKMMGFTETDIINYLAAQDKPEPTSEEKAAQAASKAADERIQAFEEAQAKKVEQERKVQDTKVIQGFKSQLSKVIEADKEKFEYCSYHGAAAEELAYEFLREVVKESGGKEAITPQEAIEMVEEYYEEQDKLMSSLKKRQPKEASVIKEDKTIERTRTVTPADPTSPQPKPPIQRTRTLTNAATATSNSIRQRGPETREEKRERLMEALRTGKLN